MKKASIKKSTALFKEAKKVIHGGGVVFLSKKPERFLGEGWPAYFKRAKGIEVVDLDDNHYLDFSYMGVGPNLLGYADPDVNAAVKRVVDAGNQSTLNSPEEVELAKELLRLHPWADQVRYARGGGEICAMAVRIARAHAGKDTIALCGYHGWHDWYLAANLSHNKSLDGHLLPGLKPAGVPRALRGSVVTFNYNRIDELEALVKKHKIGVIMMEPMRHHEPEKDFLKKVRKIADRIGAVLVFDEVSSGFRLGFPGAHARFHVYPDIAIYAKAISNGYPMAALLGRKEIMKEANESFISSLYHSERVGPVAALATLKKLRQKRVMEYVTALGDKIGAMWMKQARAHGLPLVLEGSGPIVGFTFEHKEALALKAIFTQEMLKEGYLATPSLYVSYAHRQSHMPKYEQAVKKVFGTIAKAIENGNPRRFLEGSLPETGFKRLT